LAPERFIAKQQTVFRREFLAQVSTLLAPLASANTDRRLFSELFAHDLDPLGAIALWQQTVSLPDDMLHKVDRMSMAHALEVRAPFLDARLAELLNRTSFSVKLRDGRQKYVLRKALERYLPADFVWRPKHGFAVPLAHWFKDDLAGFVRDRLLAPDAIVQRVIKQSTLTQIMADHARGARDWSNALWALLIFELWCRSSGITGDSIVDA
jgi:asparagine synthase (glutamine-hydrolysing)